jgi:hypothetical protein
METDINKLVIAAFVADVKTKTAIAAMAASARNNMVPTCNTKTLV